MFEQLNENSLWTDGASLQAHTVESATHAFFFNFFAFLSMYTISSNTIVMRNYIASETHTKLSEIDVTNHDTTASIKLAAHFKVITEQSAQRLLRLVDKIKSKQITSDDLQDEMIKKVLTELHYGTHLSSQPILKSALDDFMDGKINLPFVAYFFFKQWKKFESVNAEIADMYKKGHFSTTYSDFMTGRRKLKRGVPRHLIKNTTPLTVVFENGVVIDPNATAQATAQVAAPAAAPVQPSVAATPAPTAAFRSNMSARAAQAQAQAQLQADRQARLAAQAAAQAQAQAAAQAATQVPATATPSPAPVAGTAKLKFSDRTKEEWLKFIWTGTKFIPEHLEQIDERSLGYVVVAVYGLLLEKQAGIHQAYYEAAWALKFDSLSREALRHGITYAYLRTKQYVPDEYDITSSLSDSIFEVYAVECADMIVTLVADDITRAKGADQRRKLRNLSKAVFQTNDPSVWDHFLNISISPKDRLAALYLKTLFDTDVKESLRRNYMEYYKSSDTLKQFSSHFKVKLDGQTIEVTYDRIYNSNHKDELMLVNYLSSYFDLDVIYIPSTIANMVVQDLVNQRTPAEWANLIVKNGEFSQTSIQLDVPAQVRYEVISAAFDYMLTQIKDAEAIAKLLRSAEGLFDITPARYGEFVDKMLKKASGGEIEVAIDIPYPGGVNANKSVVSGERVIEALTAMPLSKLFVKDSLETLRKLLKYLYHYPQFDFVFSEDKIAARVALRTASIGVGAALSALHDELTEHKLIPSDMTFDFMNSTPVVDCGDIREANNKLIYDALLKVKSMGKLKFTLKNKDNRTFTITPGQRTAPEQELWVNNKINPDFVPSCSYDESKFAILDAWRKANPNTAHFDRVNVAGSEALIRSHFIEHGYKTNIAARDFMIDQVINGFSYGYSGGYSPPRVGSTYDKEVLNFVVDNAYDTLKYRMFGLKPTSYTSHLDKGAAAMHLIFNSEKFKDWGTIENMFAVPASDQNMYYTIAARYFKYSKSLKETSFARNFFEFIQILSQDDRFKPHVKFQIRDGRIPDLKLDTLNVPSSTMLAWLYTLNNLYSSFVNMSGYDGKTVFVDSTGKVVKADVTKENSSFPNKPNLSMYYSPLDIDQSVLANLEDDDCRVLGEVLKLWSTDLQKFDSNFWYDAKKIRDTGPRIGFVRVLLSLLPMTSDADTMSLLMMMDDVYKDDKVASALIKPYYDKQAEVIKSSSDAPDLIAEIYYGVTGYRYRKKETLQKLFEFAPKDKVYPQRIISALIDFKLFKVTDPFMELQIKGQIKETGVTDLLEWGTFYAFMHLPEVEDAVVSAIEMGLPSVRKVVEKVEYFDSVPNSAPSKKFIDACVKAGMVVKNNRTGPVNSYAIKTYPKNLLECAFFSGRTIEPTDENYLSYNESMRVNFWLNKDVSDDYKMLDVDLIREAPNSSTPKVAEKNSHNSKMTSYIYALGYSTKDEQLKLLEYCQIDDKYVREAFFKPELQMIATVAKNASNLHEKTMKWILNVLSGFLHSGPGTSQMRREAWNKFFPHLPETLKLYADAGGDFKLKKTNRVPALLSDNQVFLIRQQISDQSTKYGLDIGDVGDELLQIGIALNEIEFGGNFDNIKTMSDLTSIVAAGQTAVTLKEPFVSRLPIEDLPTRIRRGRDMTLGGFSGRHRDQVPLVLESYEVNKPGNKERVEAFRQSINGEYTKNLYHSCGSLAASFILRYGFKNVTDPKLVVGKLLGDGLYVAKHVDKTIQYATNRTDYTDVGDVGYMIVFDVVFGKVSNDPDDIPKSEYDTIMAPGVGSLSKIRTAEWCLRRAEDQAVYVAAHKVQVTHVNALEKMAADNNVPWVE